VLGVAVLAPWFAELSWGGLPFTDLPAVLLFLAPLYGSAALLVREVARRTGRGWPTILLLGAGFGVVQAGLVDQSLFNPAYGAFDFQQPVHVPGVDVSLYYLVSFVSGHAVASIAAPIAMAECWSTRAREPWLSRRSMAVVAVLYVLASVVNHVGVAVDEGHGFQARPAQMAAAAALAVVLVVCALRWPRASTTSVSVPPPWLLGVVGFLAYLLYLPGEGAAALVVALAVGVGVALPVGRWSRSTAWSSDHAVALVMGSILVGVVMPFLTEPYDPSTGRAREAVADVVAAIVCGVLVVLALWRRRATGRPRVDAEGRAEHGVPEAEEGR